MKNLVSLPDEYWYSLSIMADDLGYKSRQEMVAEILRGVVDREPGLLEKGVEKTRITEQAVLRVKGREKRGMIAPFEVPIRSEGARKRYKLVKQDGTPLVVFANTLLEAGRDALRKPELTMDEFWQEFKEGKTL